MFLRCRDCNDIITILAIETLLFFRNFFKIDVMLTTAFLAEKYHDQTLAIFHTQLKQFAGDRL
jgi:hypothetical protein